MRVNEEEIEILLVAYNEVGTIETEIEAWHKHVLSYFPNGRIHVAEDGSSDGTSELLRDLHRRGRIVHNHSQAKRGYRRAFLDGLADTTAAHVVFADTGGKFDVRDFWSLFPYRADADLIVARKVLRTDSYHRRAMTRGYNLAIRRYFGIEDVFDADSGLRLFNSRVRDYILTHDLIFEHLINSEIVIRANASGFEYVERPTAYSGRDGKSRGLPTQELPRIIWSVLSKFPELKRQLYRDQSSNV